MNHFVVGPDGQKYGPADLATLNTWIADGRLHPQSFLEEEGTGRRMPASSVPGLVFAVPTAGMVPPIGVAYPRGYPASVPLMPSAVDSKQILMAFGFPILAIIVAAFIGYFSFFFAVWGIQIAWGIKNQGHRVGWVAVVFNVLAIIAVLIVRFGFRSMRVL